MAGSVALRRRDLAARWAHHVFPSILPTTRSCSSVVKFKNYVYFQTLFLYFVMVKTNFKYVNSSLSTKKEKWFV